MWIFVWYFRFFAKHVAFISLLSLPFKNDLREALSYKYSKWRIGLSFHIFVSMICLSAIAYVFKVKNDIQEGWGATASAFDTLS